VTEPADPDPRPVWTVGPVETSPARDELRVVIDDEPVVVRARGHRLHDRPEAWGTLLAIPAARTGTAVSLPGAVDPVWTAGAQANVAQMADWWGGRPVLDLQAPKPTRGARLRAAFGLDGPAARGRALCFTGGVDSFFSLLAGDHRPSHLLFVHGFDLALDDHDRRAAATTAIAAVAAARHLTPIEVETDLRHHHCFAQASWEHTHGAALVCIALLLRREIGTLVIPPSYAEARLVPWGSHPETDQRWSVPDALTVEHGDARLVRRQRLAAIADDPLVHQHLRVCWAHLSSGTNCGRCEKCVRTMVDLEALGRLGDVTTFPRDRPLAAVVDGLDAIPAGVIPLWLELRALTLPPDVTGAIERLLARSDGTA